MSAIPAHPDSDPIYGLYGGGFAAQFTRLALLLDLFTPLTSGPKSADEVAACCGASLSGVRALLNYMNSVGILDYDPDRRAFSLTPTAATFLVPDRESYAGDWVLANTDPTLWEKTLQTLRTGRSTGYRLPWAQDAWLESHSPSRIAYSLDLWRSVGVAIDGDRPFRVLDLASGCGIKSLALAQANQAVRVTCVDSASVLEVARDLAVRLGVSERTALVPADILLDDFGAGQYDAVLLGLVTYLLTPEQDTDLFRRAFWALKPGGRLVIDAIMSTDQPGEWASRATLLMSTFGGGAAYSFEEYRSWLVEAGFAVVSRHNDQLLSAMK